MTLRPSITFDFVKFREEAVSELIELQKQARDDFLKWAAEKLAVARKDFGSEATELLEGQQLLPYTKTPRATRSRRARRSSVSENTVKESQQRATRYSKRNALRESAKENVSQDELYELPKTRKSRRKQKVSIENELPKRRTRAATRKAVESEKVHQQVDSSEDILCTDLVEEKVKPTAKDVVAEMDVGCAVETVDPDELQVPSTIYSTRLSDPMTMAAREEMDTNTGGGDDKDVNLPKTASATQSSTRHSLKDTEDSDFEEPVRQSKRIKRDTTMKPKKAPSRKGKRKKGVKRTARTSSMSSQASITCSSPSSLTSLLPEEHEQEQPEPTGEGPSLSPPRTTCDETCTVKGEEQDRLSGQVHTTSRTTPMSPPVEEQTDRQPSLACTVAEDETRTVSPPRPEMLPPAPAYMKTPEAFRANHKKGTSFFMDDMSLQQSSMEVSNEVTYIDQVVGGRDSHSRTDDTTTVAETCEEIDSRQHIDHPDTCSPDSAPTLSEIQNGTFPKVADSVKELPSEGTKSSVKSSKHTGHDSNSGKEVLEKFFDSLLKSKKQSSCSNMHSEGEHSPRVPLNDGTDNLLPSSKEEYTRDVGLDGNESSVKEALEKFFDSLVKRKKRSTCSNVHSEDEDSPKVPPNDRTDNLPPSSKEEYTKDVDLVSDESSGKEVLEKFFDSLVKSKKTSVSGALGIWSPSVTKVTAELMKKRSSESMNLVQQLLSGLREEHKPNGPSSLETEELRETTNHGEFSPVPSEDAKETVRHDEPPQVEPEESRQSGDADRLTQSRGSSNDGYYTADEKEGELLEATKPETRSQVEEENDIATTGGNAQKHDCKDSSQTASKKPYQHLLAAWFGKPEQDAGHEKPTLSKSSNKPVSFFTTPLPANAPMLGSEAGPARQRSPMKKAHGAKMDHLSKLAAYKDLKYLTNAKGVENSSNATNPSKKSSKLLVSFLPQSQSPSKPPNGKTKIQEVSKKLENQEKRVKEMELKRQKELEEKIKKREQRELLVLQRKAEMMEMEKTKKLNLIASKEEKMKKSQFVQKKKFIEHEKQRKKLEEQYQAVLLRRKQQEDEYQKKLMAQLEEERRIAEENEARRLAYEERERQRRKEEEMACRIPEETIGRALGEGLPAGLRLPALPLSQTFTKLNTVPSSHTSKGTHVRLASPSKNKHTETVTAYTTPKVPPNPISYEMTPDVLGNVDTYSIDDLNSSDDTDCEDDPSKPIPSWAQSANLNASIKKQELARWDINAIFPPNELLLPPNLTDIFKRKRPRYHYRTSSANWNTPPKKRHYYV